MSVPDGTIGANRVLFNNRANDLVYTLSATTEATTFDVENAIDGIPANTWKSTAITQTYITLNGTAAAAIRGCYIFNHNITGGSVTFNLETSDDDFSSTDTSTAFTTVSRTETEKVNGIIQSVSYNDAYVFIATTCQDVRISMIQTATNTYHKIGMIYLFMNDFEIPPPCYRWGATRGPESVKSQNTGQYGQQNERFQFQRYTESYDYPKLPVAILPLMSQIAANEQVVWMPDGINGKHFLGSLSYGVPVEILGGQNFQMSGTFTGAL
jgi:hypothetical protein